MARIVLLFLLVPILAACGGTSDPAAAPEEAATPPVPPDGTRERPFIGRGVITEIRGNIIQIDHETIPGFMAAVTMDFPLEDPRMAAGLEPGQAVVFSIERTRWDYRVIRIEEIGEIEADR